ncbi:hypothetical protein niasHT_037628 [Heterodera trifolii]|uniref:Uncharacterized protein n=1 Tax=Heterodera trifolii TaxID=157864 RepID=A0ABD2IDR8_9BILA
MLANDVERLVSAEKSIAEKEKKWDGFPTNVNEFGEAGTSNRWRQHDDGRWRGGRGNRGRWTTNARARGRHWQTNEWDVRGHQQTETEQPRNEAKRGLTPWEFTQMAGYGPGY